MFFDRSSLLTRDCHFAREFAVEAKMQIDLTGTAAWDFALLSKPQPLQPKPIWAQGNKRAMHPLFAPNRLCVYRLAQRLVQKPPSPGSWHHPCRFSERSPVSMWLILAAFMVVSINAGAALLHLVAIPVQ
jgi:hypothetical protein